MAYTVAINENGGSSCFNTGDVHHDEDSSSSNELGEGVNDNATKGGESQEAKETLQALARAETKALTCLRTVVFGVLLVAAIILSERIHRFTKNSEQKEFISHVQINSQKVMDSFRDSVERKLGTMNALSTAITSHALATQQKFPFVYVDDFAVRAANVRVQADAVVLHFLPVVTDDNREAWEEYALKHRFQIDRSFLEDDFFRKDQDERLGYPVPNNTNANYKLALEAFASTVNPNRLEDGTEYKVKIFDNKNPQGIPEGKGPFLPMWQWSPVNAQKQRLQNADYSGVLSLPVMLKDPKAMIGRAVIPQGPIVPFFNANLKIGHKRHENYKEFINDPVSFLAYPVFENFSTQLKKVGGVVAANMYWRYYFIDTLPPNAKGFICVLENSFNQTHSFRLDGANVEYLGAEDYHDSKYDKYIVKENVNEYLAQNVGANTASYTSVPLSTDYGSYALRVYPSEDTEVDFQTSKPIIYTVVVILVFLITSCVFLIFNMVVERRQAAVMDRAIKSGALVSSLFPKEVHDRLYEQSKPKNDNNNRVIAGGAGILAKNDNEWKVDKERDVGTNGVDGGDGVSPSLKYSGIIADSFPETTILFADLKGFTAWSDEHQPEEVFHLLETLYSAFDIIAKRRHVFKVETIGDCYLAVTGLPSPQPDHAVRMARFANDCIHKMEECVKKLTSTLGESTCELQLRVGLHSGPVTAGVLRGEKGRFQLFGDTVNTASRMESNGVPGKIHVSQETANELVKHGKSDWLLSREDKIMAKGKGELQTYFVVVKGNAKSNRTGTESVSSNM